LYLQERVERVRQGQELSAPAAQERMDEGGEDRESAEMCRHYLVPSLAFRQMQEEQHLADSIGGGQERALEERQNQETAFEVQDRDGIQSPGTAMAAAAQEEEHCWETNLGELIEMERKLGVDGGDTFDRIVKNKKQEESRQHEEMSHVQREGGGAFVLTQRGDENKKEKHGREDYPQELVGGMLSR